jgi:hypothetical protein
MPFRVYGDIVHMSDKFWPNFTIDTTTSNNSFSAIWALTRVIKAAGGVFKSCGNGTTKVTTGVAADDLWGGNANPLLDTYASVQAQLDSRAAWWCAELASTVKIGIGAASVGTFLRDEVVTQATSGATGKLLGYVINSANNSGWIIIMPHTGTFDATHQIVGGRSGATVTATSYTLLRRQIVVAKNTTVSAGWIFYEAVTQAEIDASSNTALFSDLAVNAANCNATVAPGNSASSNNRFPSYAIPMVGTPESTGQAFFGITTGFGKAQVTATNLTPAANTEADGTFFVAMWDASNSVYRVLSMMRLDKQEPGDIDPYIIMSVTSEGLTSPTTGRAAATTSGSSGAGGFYGLLGNLIGIPAKGYCARATGTMGSGLDVYSPFVLGANTNFGTGTPSLISQSSNTSYPPKIRNHPDAPGGTSPYPIERVRATSLVDSITMRKGSCRNLALLPSASIADTANNKTWLALTANAGTTNPALVIGPMDGSTTPLKT